MPLDKPLESLTETELLQLITDKVDERRVIEYKQVLHGGTDLEIKELLADVASFANADGGHIIYGMREEGGTPVELLGFDIDSDAAILRMESSIRDGIDPRIPGVETCKVNLSNSRTAIVLRIPKSWISPHMVKFKGSSRFFSRASNGKYQLDVHQIGSAYLMRESTANRIRDFHADRIGRIVGNRAIMAMPETAKIALHIIPLTAFDQSFAIDIKLITQNHIAEKLGQSLCGYLSDGRFNLDGYVRFHLNGKSMVAERYLQLFRSGIIEVVDADIMIIRDRNIAIDSLESKIIEVLPLYFKVLASFGVRTPIYVMIALDGVNGYQFERRRHISRYEAPIIDRNLLLLPEILIEDYACDIGRELRPAYDALWQAAGWRGSPNYDETGTRKWAEL